jgi:DNA polymerase I
MLDRLPFKHVVVADSEFHFGGHDSFAAAARSGERQRPVCMWAKELRSGQTWRIGPNETGPQAPFPTGPDTLFIAYYASAEIGTFLPWNWPQPTYVLDLFTEFRARTNGLSLPNGASLLGALTCFGLDGIDVTEKQELRALILAGGPWAAADMEAIFQYCESDVVALEHLLPAMLPHIDLPRALLRGRFMKAAAIIEWNGTPIDTPTLALLRQHWHDIQDDLITAVDYDYGVFEGRTFKLERWKRWLAAHGIPWPRLESGRLDLSDDTFRQMARAYPAVSPMRELRSALSEMRLSDLAVSFTDHRNRTLLSCFRSRTGRCQPSNTRYIFGPSVWLRSLVQPPPRHGVAYIDWCQQEHGIAAVLSGDGAMQAAYLSGDPYLEFAQARRTQFRPTQPSIRIRPSANCSSNVHWPWRTGWRRKGSPAASGNRPSSAATYCGHIGKRIAGFGRGRMRPSITPCSPARCKPYLAGRSMSAKIQIPVRYAISPCRPTAPNCYGSPVASQPNRASKFAPSSTMRC